MGQTEIIQLTRQQPFRPFRLVLSNNQAFDIRHPDMALATPWAVHVGIPASAPAKDAAQEAVIVSLNHIVKIEFLAAMAPSASNGPAKA
jgi:hypothetical protein